MPTSLTARSNRLSAVGEESKQSRRTALFLFSLFLLAVSVRLGWRIHKGSADFWANGYSFFYELAINVVAGNGLNIEGGGWAMRTPAYPLFLALTALGGKNYLWIIIPQALMGAGTVLCAFHIGKELFGQTTGILASILTAFYPYYVIHDTALQETSMFTFLTALSVFLLLRSKAVIAGLALGAAVLTRPTLAPFAVGAILWIGARCPRRLSRIIAILLPFSLVVGFWLARNCFLIGAPVLTSELGRQLWIGNNANTFTHYPSGSIDLSAAEALAAVTPAEQHELEALPADEVRQSDWFLNKALDYIRAHPVETIRAASRKIMAGFSWRFNPAREPYVQLVYFVSYTPILILGMLGIMFTWRQWREHGLIYLLFLAFIGVTAVFWAHTSHRSYLDVYLIVFAAYALNHLFPIARLMAPLNPVRAEGSSS